MELLASLQGGTSKCQLGSLEGRDFPLPFGANMSGLALLEASPQGVEATLTFTTAAGDALALL